MRCTLTALMATAGVLAGAACAGQTPAPPATGSSTTYPIGALNGKTAAQLGEKRPGVRAWMSPAAAGSKNLVYVGNLGTQSVEIFHQAGKNQQPIGSITSGISDPGGMAVDGKGNLYVADEREIGSEWNVPMYAPGSTSPTKVFTTDLSSPTAVAVAHDGTVYVTNFNELSNGWVSVYPKGNQSKEYRLADFNGGAPLEIGLDKSGNVYVMYDTNDTGGSAVNEYAPGAKTGTNLNLQFKWGAGIQVDEAGNILVVQQLQPAEILVFAPGKTSPSKTITEPNGDQSFSFALNPTDKQLITDDQTANQVDVLAYPSGKFKHAVATGFEEPTGLALSKPQF
jgi:hypothetical protein